MTYGAAGQAVWYATGGLYHRVTTGAGLLPMLAGMLHEYAGGATLAGISGQLRILGERGSIQARFTSPTAGTLTLPGGQNLAISRFSF